MRRRAASGPHGALIAVGAALRSATPTSAPRPPRRSLSTNPKPRWSRTRTLAELCHITRISNTSRNAPPTSTCTPTSSSSSAPWTGSRRLRAAPAATEHPTLCSPSSRAYSPSGATAPRPQASAPSAASDALAFRPSRASDALRSDTLASRRARQRRLQCPNQAPLERRVAENAGPLDLPEAIEEGGCDPSRDSDQQR